MKNRPSISSLPKFLLCVISVTAETGCTRTVDLSAADFDPTPTYNANDGAEALFNLIESSAGEDQVLSFVVLDDGLKVAEWYNDHLNVTTTTTDHVFSINKYWTGLLFGVLQDEGYLTMDETLGEVWPYPSHEIWSTVDDEASQVQEITVGSLLSMSSGFDDASFDKIDLNNVGGANLTDVLNFVVHEGEENEGKFDYLGFGNILGYIVKEKTGGMTPKEYADKHIFPYLGIGEDSYEWSANTDGVHYTRNGLHLTATQMAKWAQLYLQGGVSNTEGHRVVSKEWIEFSKEKEVFVPPSDSLYQMMSPSEEIDVEVWYGHKMFIFPDEDMFLGYGARGQFMAFWPGNCRAASIKMNFATEAELPNSKLAFRFLRLINNATFVDEVIDDGAGGDAVGMSDVTSSVTHFGGSIVCVSSVALAIVLAVTI